MRIFRLLALAALVLPIAAHAASPAVEAATRGWLDQVSGAARAKSDAYFEGGYWLILWDAVVAIGAAWLLLATGWSARIEARVERITARRWLQPALYIIPYLLVTALLTLPWTIYEGYVREKQYGFMNQSFAGWLGDQGIGLIVSMISMALLVIPIFAVIRRSPRRWWLWGTGVAAVFLFIGFVISPVFIAPLFNTYRPMPAGPLRDRILAMAHANHIPADNVYVFDASRQSKRVSANVSGIAGTMRISLNDNLLNRTSPAEVSAVMGHEMGHYVLGHIWRGLFFYTLNVLVGLLLAWWLAPRLIARHPGWGVRGVADPAAVPVLGMILTALSFALTPEIYTLIRVDEAQADAFGLDAAREPDGFAKVTLKLSEYRKLEPGRLEEMLLYDHPSGATRIRRAMQWKEDHGLLK